MVPVHVPVVVMTSPVSNWTLGGLFWTIEKYAPELSDITVFGYEELTQRIDDVLRSRASWHRIGDFADYPKKKWSDSFIYVLEYMLSLGKKHFMFMMDDFWLVRRVDARGISLLYDGIRRNNNVLKIDLAADRLYASGGAPYLYGRNTIAREGHIDLIASNPKSAYHMSLWVGLFNAELLLEHVLVPGETAQEIEIAGTARLSEVKGVDVLGTRQAPVLCTNVLRSGHEGPEYRGYMFDDQFVNGISEGDLAAMKQEGVEVR